MKIDPSMSALRERIKNLETELVGRDAVIAKFDFDVCPRLSERILELEAALREARSWMHEYEIGSTAVLSQIDALLATSTKVDTK